MLYPLVSVPVYSVNINILVELILSDIDVEAESELLILHCIGCHDSGVAAFVSRGGSQFIVMAQKLLKGALIFQHVSL